MPERDQLVVDEERRVEQHEKIKRQVQGEVQKELIQDAEQVRPAEKAQVKAVSETLKSKAIHEVAESEAEIHKGRTFARIAQVVNYVFYLVYGLIGLEIFLELIGARERAGFKQFMNTITAPLLGPFHGLVADPAVGQFQFMGSYFVALIIYALLHVAIRGLLRVLAIRSQEI